MAFVALPSQTLADRRRLPSRPPGQYHASRMAPGPGSWNRTREGAAHALVTEICAAPAGSAAQQRAWTALLRLIGGHIESWTGKNWVLRGAGLGSEDEGRALLIRVFERLRYQNYRNLHRYLDWCERRTPSPPPPPDGSPAEGAAAADDVTTAAEVDEALAGPPADDEGVAELADSGLDDPDAAGDDVTGTPLRAWVLGLIDMVADEHVRYRVGWRRQRRGLLTDAAPLDAAGQVAASAPSPLTALCGVAEIDSERARVHLALQRLKPRHRRVLQLYCRGLGAADIARALHLGRREAENRLEAARRNLKRALQEIEERTA
jgi:DNA-directed RNA polymerase specialized sigma24 family protein